jgi:alkylation response protein AidB-like acyl-CoA dehydrogenase
MSTIKLITAPDAPSLAALCDQLAARADATDVAAAWPVEQLRWLAEAGVYRWFVPREWGGLEWSEQDLVRGYLRLSAACLTTTFILTQRSGAVRRIVESENQTAKEKLLPGLVDGSTFATVGISHLTTSRRHLAKPVLAARETASGFVLDGFSPWVTGAEHADTVALGATLDDGRQILVALPTSLPGVSAPSHAKLIGLTASHTGPLECRNVEVDRQWLLDGPAENVMTHRGGTKTGGLQTSALAIGLSSAAIDFLERESRQRPDLVRPTESLRAEYKQLEADLLSLAAGIEACTADDLRARANSLVLRAAQSALAAAKGTGYVTGHPTGRWCREALFFLVWSCPQPVMASNLCELAGLG